MSTPLLPEVVSEIDANPVTFYWGGGGWVSQLPGVYREFAKYGEGSKFAASIGHQKLKGFQLQEALPPSPLTRGSTPGGPHWGLCPQTPL